MYTHFCQSATDTHVSHVKKTQHVWHSDSNMFEPQKWEDSTGASIIGKTVDFLYLECYALYTNTRGDVLLVCFSKSEKKKHSEKLSSLAFLELLSMQAKRLRGDEVGVLNLFSCPGSEAYSITLLSWQPTSKTLNPSWGPNTSFTGFIYSRHWCQV